MKTSILILALALCGAIAAISCSSAQEKQAKKDTLIPAEVKRIPVAKNVTLEIDGDSRRVVVEAYVCLRQGMLEQFLTRKNAKEHESLLAADADARDIHTALLAAGAEAGKPVQFRPKYVPASGSTVKVFVEYDNKGKKTRQSAREWIRDVKSKKDLNVDWIFGGSYFIQNPADPKADKFYAANDGDVICVSNFPEAMLDLPVESTASNEDLEFEANTDRIPPLKTAVKVILEPVAKKK